MRRLPGNAYPNTAAQFVAASSRFLSVADNASLDFSTAMTFSCWLWADTIATNRCFAAKWVFQTDGSWAFQSGTAVATELQFGYALTAADAAGSRGRTTTLGMVANQWYHVTVVYDGSQGTDATKVVIYVDAVQRTLTFDGGAGNVPTSLLNSAADLNLGKWGGTLTRYWDGRMDSVGLWSRALSAAENAQLYKGGVGMAYRDLDAGLKTNLVSWWNMDGTFNDSHGTNNLSNNNGVSFAGGKR